jgi:hypothetical protein
MATNPVSAITVIVALLVYGEFGVDISRIWVSHTFDEGSPSYGAMTYEGPLNILIDYYVKLDRRLTIVALLWRALRSEMQPSAAPIAGIVREAFAA